MIAYTVRCRVPDDSMAEKYRHWLQEGHLRDVCDAGALSAQLVELNEPEHCFEARYLFADRSSFEAYEQSGAPRLREEGLALFPPDSGVTFERTLGEVLLVDVAEAPGS